MDRPVDGLGNTGNLKIINQSKQSGRDEIAVFPWARWRTLTSGGGGEYKSFIVQWVSDDR